MDRRDFIKKGCIACSSLGLLSAVLAGCAPVRYTSGKLVENGLLVDPAEFSSKGGPRSYLIVRHEDLQYPICVYRLGEQEYSALLMKCTHQGAELQVAGDQLVCPAHGSEFDKRGKLMQAPASSDLRSFPVTVLNNQLFIDLRNKS